MTTGRTWIWRVIGVVVIAASAYFIAIRSGSPIGEYVDYFRHASETSAAGQKPCLRCGKPGNAVQYEELRVTGKSNVTMYYCSEHTGIVPDSSAHSEYLSQIGIVGGIGGIAAWFLIASFRTIDPAKAARREAEKDATITDRKCPQCGAPCPSYRETCKACGANVGRAARALKACVEPGASCPAPDTPLSGSVRSGVTIDPEIQEVVEKHKTPCVVGSITTSGAWPIGCSKKGGLPDVSDQFVWPTYQGKHLSFIVQIEARYFLGNDVPGLLSFFWNERNWGDSIEDDGAFCVLHIEHPSSRLDVAPHSYYKTLGLFRRTYAPTIWKEQALDFRGSFSLPSLERLDHSNYDWDCDRDDLYNRAIEEQSAFLRIGGFPNPVQNDDMEENCARIRKHGSAESWQLLLEIDSDGDMMWGDAGRLYWFIHKDDFAKRDFTRVWMEVQCH